MLLLVQPHVNDFPLRQEHRLNNQRSRPNDGQHYHDRQQCYCSVPAVRLETGLGCVQQYAHAGDKHQVYQKKIFGRNPLYELNGFIDW